VSSISRTSFGLEDAASRVRGRGRSDSRRVSPRPLDHRAAGLRDRGEGTAGVMYPALHACRRAGRRLPAYPAGPGQQAVSELVAAAPVRDREGQVARGPRSIRVRRTAAPVRRCSGGYRTGCVWRGGDALAPRAAANTEADHPSDRRGAVLAGGAGGPRNSLTRHGRICAGIVVYTGARRRRAAARGTAAPDTAGRLGRAGA